MYRERMLGYYPQAIQSVQEFQAIINSEYPEIELVSDADERIISDAYLLTMSEDRVSEWERFLGIRPEYDSDVSTRRDAVIGRIRAQNKLNTTTINSVVNAFTGGTAQSWVEDSTLHVVITPPLNYKLYNLDAVIQELSRKIPAHLGLSVTRTVNSWADVKNKNTGWKEVRACHSDWNAVLHNERRNPNELDRTVFSEFYLDNK